MVNIALFIQSFFEVKDTPLGVDVLGFQKAQMIWYPQWHEVPRKEDVFRRMV